MIKSREHTIEIIQNIMKSFKNEKIAITGSLVFAELGLMDYKDVKDIDLTIHDPSTPTIALLNLFKSISPVKRKIYYGQSKDQVFQFSTDGVDIDVFISPKPFVTIFTRDGIPMVLPTFVIDAKKKLGRHKDLNQLIKLSTKFFKVEDIGSHYYYEPSFPL